MTDFGRSVWCVDSLQPGRYAVGIMSVAQNAYHRLITPTGMLGDDPDYGLDLAGLCGSDHMPSTLASLPRRIEAELLKDERIRAVDVDATVTEDGPAATWTIEVRAHTDAGPFELVLAVGDVSVELLGLEVE